MSRQTQTQTTYPLFIIIYYLSLLFIIIFSSPLQSSLHLSSALLSNTLISSPSNDMFSLAILAIRCIAHQLQNFILLLGTGEIKVTFFSQVVSTASASALHFGSWLKFPLFLSTPQGQTLLHQVLHNLNSVHKISPCLLQIYRLWSWLQVITANLWHWLFLCALNFYSAFFQFWQTVLTNAESAFDANLDLHTRTIETKANYNLSTISPESRVSYLIGFVKVWHVHLADLGGVQDPPLLLHPHLHLSSLSLSFSVIVSNSLSLLDCIIWNTHEKPYLEEYLILN